MPVFILAIYDIVDAEAYQHYITGVIPLLQKHGAEVLVADHDANALEGRAGSNYVVLKFESEAAALAWYNDPAYQPVKKVRLNTTANGRLVLTKQWAPPA